MKTTTKALGEDHKLMILARMELDGGNWSSRRWLWRYIGPPKTLDLNLDLIRDFQCVLGIEYPTTLLFVYHTANLRLLKIYFPEPITLRE